MSSNGLYIWIVRWHDFQHYAPERDRAPAWIKAYTKQHDDERYTDLSPRRRALLHDLRLAFARSGGQLRYDTRKLSGRIAAQVRDDDVEALNHAGFLEIVSRETLEQRLEEFYSESRQPSRARARPRSRENQTREKEEEETSNRSEVPREVTAARNGTLDVKSELLLAELLNWIGPDADTRTAAVVRHALSQASEAAIVELKDSLPTAKPRHRAKYVVGTLKVASARARSAA